MKSSASSNIFVRIWNWIKNTAWIQPLLIVGIIFGIIFSIPSITTAIKNAQTKYSSAETYYGKYQLSLAGEDDSPAQKLINNILDENLDGQKFFLVFVASDCSACEEAKGGFYTLQHKFSKSELGGNSFAMKTIFTDEDTNENDLTTTAFVHFLLNPDTAAFMSNVVDYVKETSVYYQKHMLGQSTRSAADDILDSIENGTESSSLFQTPTVMLVDFTEKAIAANRYGVTQAFVGVPGDDNYDKALFLADCWNGTGDFAD